MSTQIIDQDIIQDEKPLDYTGKKYRLLNDASIFYKGLFGMILCILPGFIMGLILINMAMSQYGEIKEDLKHPEQYKEKSLKLVRLGRLFSLIGVGAFITEIVVLVVYMSIN